MSADRELTMRTWAAFAVLNQMLTLCPVTSPSIGPCNGVKANRRRNPAMNSVSASGSNSVLVPAINRSAGKPNSMARSADSIAVGYPIRVGVHDRQHVIRFRIVRPLLQKIMEHFLGLGRFTVHDGL